MNSSATPSGGMLFGRLVEQSPLTCCVVVCCCVLVVCFRVCVFVVCVLCVLCACVGVGVSCRPSVFVSVSGHFVRQCSRVGTQPRCLSLWFAHELELISGVFYFCSHASLVPLMAPRVFLVILHLLVGFFSCFFAFVISFRAFVFFVFLYCVFFCGLFSLFFSSVLFFFDIFCFFIFFSCFLS